MANDCLVTTLKATVNNSNLKKLGVIALKATQKTITNDAQQYIQVKLKAPITIKVGEGGAVALTKSGLSAGNRELTVSTLNQMVSVWFSNGTYDIDIKNKDNINAFNIDGLTGASIFSLDVSDLAFCGSLISFTFSFVPLTGTMMNLNKNTAFIRIYNNPFDLDIQELADCTSLSTLDIDYCNKVTGEITDLAKCTTLTTLKIQSTQITGTIESFVASQVNEGRTSCSNITVNNILRSISFGGQKLADKARAEYLEWSSADKITMYLGDNGSTTKANCSLIWAKGATAEEISTWEQAGKTVRVIS